MQFALGLIFLTYKNSVSLKKNTRFQNVYKNGKAYPDKFLVFIILPNDANVTGFGITVSRKVGNSVVRSRVTRLIRQAYRLNEENVTGISEFCGKFFDIVVIARASCRNARFSDVERSFLYCLNKAKRVSYGDG